MELHLEPIRCTAFAGSLRIASGRLADVAVKAAQVLQQGETVLIFDDDTCRPVEVDLRGTPEEVRQRLTSSEVSDTVPRSAGRPRLGVVAREVTLLPRHWEWLGRQPGGASVALRKLVEHASRELATADRQRDVREAAYRFMSAMAGNEPGFEEASRALFAGDRDEFDRRSEGWPADIRDYARRIAYPSFP